MTAWKASGLTKTSSMSSVMTTKSGRGPTTVKTFRGSLCHPETNQGDCRSRMREKPTMNRVVERIYSNHHLIYQIISDPKNAREMCGVGFAKVLKDRLEQRFHDKGMNCPKKRQANYLDTKFNQLE